MRRRIGVIAWWLGAAVLAATAFAVPSALAAFDDDAADNGAADNGTVTEQRIVRITKRAVGAGPDRTFSITNTDTGETTLLADGESWDFAVDVNSFPYFTELKDAAWPATGVSCSGEDAPVIYDDVTSWAFDVVVGDSDIECTLTNEQVPAVDLTFHKDAGGDTTTEFGIRLFGPLLIDEFDITEGAPVTVESIPVGTVVSFEEVDLPAGWRMTGLHCDGAEVSGSGPRAVIRLGEVDAVCTVVNEPPPTITIVKTVVGDAPSQRFDFAFPSGDGTIAVQLGHGESYRLTATRHSTVEFGETHGVPWSATLDCGSAPSRSVTRFEATTFAVDVATEDVTCTVTNTPLDFVDVTFVMSSPADTDVAVEFVVSSSRLFESFALSDGESHTFEASVGNSLAVLEVLPFEWTLDRVDCSPGSSLSSFDATGEAQLSVGPEGVVCTFGNEPPASVPLTLTKRAEGPPNSAEFLFVSADFSEITLADGDSATVQLAQGAVVRFSEIAPAGWRAESIDCGPAVASLSVVGGVGSLVVRTGTEPISCTVVNRFVGTTPPTNPIELTIAKQAQPGGLERFGFEVLAGGATVEANLGDGESFTIEADAGAFIDVLEYQPADWTLTELECTNATVLERTEQASLVTASLRLGAADASCTFTNQPLPTVTVTKVVEGDGLDGLTSPPRFRVESDAGESAWLGDGQSYEFDARGRSLTLTEAADDRYVLVSIDCDLDVAHVDVDLSARRVAIDVPDAVMAVDCTFVNRLVEPTTVIISKEVDRPTERTAFVFRRGGGGFLAWIFVGEGVQLSIRESGTITVAEDLTGGWAIESIDCGVASQIVDLAAASITFDAAPGSTVRCVFTNTPPNSATLTITKAVDGVDDGTAFDFIGPYDSSFSLSAGEAHSIRVEADVAHAIEEVPQPGWQAGPVVCDGASGVVGDAGRFEVTLAAGATANCVVTNVAPAQPALTLGDTDRPATAVDPSAPLDVSLAACEGGVGRWRLIDRDGGEVASGPLQEQSAGTYSGVIDYVPVYSPGGSPGGPYMLLASVTCGAFEQSATQTVEYIDPEGTVVDCAGSPVRGATVRLLRAASATGPFGAVADGDTSVMDPAVNARNPVVTGGDGRFQWFTVAGWYQVEASLGGAVAQTQPLPVPPPQIGLRLVLPVGACGASGAPNTTGPVVDRVALDGASGEAPSSSPLPLGAPTPELAHTGSEPRLVVMAALAGLGAGCSLVGWGRSSRRLRWRRPK
ncbi:MAG: hypothetical protein AAF567_12405 [Actinomycetota bacterium]